ncbi:hypothetical protein WJX72_011416 [[Myrmecia] bisecta]|uniref:DNA 3'-5' helicase n=1 Tax=[Myrmecia] bisecta TaxID=41462 RepID=A0AAW1P533_9CHLO
MRPMTPSGGDGTALKQWVQAFVERSGRRPGKSDLPPDLAQAFVAWQATQRPSHALLAGCARLPVLGGTESDSDSDSKELAATPIKAASQLTNWHGTRLAAPENSVSQRPEQMHVNGKENLFTRAATQTLDVGRPAQLTARGQASPQTSPGVRGAAQQHARAHECSPAARPTLASACAGSGPPCKQPKRDNFIRMNMKGGSGKFQFKSKSGSTGRTKRFSRFKRFKPSLLKQAGEGADYLEGWRNQSRACFKCGQTGHWAQACPGIADPQAALDAASNGELQVVRNVLQGHSTLAILPTGAGKSLCYQLPALVLGGTVLEGKLRILYVAPERLHSSLLQDALAPLLPLPLVCVDEAHCVAEWGHNFRSAYFRLGHMLRERVACRAVLALTATATRATEAAIADVLNIRLEHVVREASMRENLRLSVVHKNGGTATGAFKRMLLALLKDGALRTAPSVIVYCIFQAQTDEVAAFLFSHGIAAVSYHAGQTMQAREQSQDAFCRGRVQVVVATVAFGMGLDASCVRAVVHLSLPRSLEDYVQQVGRAGRDGEEACCYLFLDDADFLRLRSLSHSDGVEVHSVCALLEAVFPPRPDPPQQGDGPAYGLVPVKEMCRQADMKQEVMETLLSYLEADNEPYVNVLPTVGKSISVAFYKHTPEQLALNHSIVEMLLAACPHARRGCYTVATAKFANQAGAPPTEVLRQLQQLAVQEELRFEVHKLQGLMFEVLRRPEDLEALARQLAQRHHLASKAQADRLDTVYRVMAAAAKEPCGRQNHEQTLRAFIEDYFERTDVPSSLGNQPSVHGLPVRAQDAFLARDIRALLMFGRSKPGLSLSGRAVARIMHGLASPAFPAEEWSKCGFWARYADMDFEAISRQAGVELVAVRHGAS